MINKFFLSIVAVSFLALSCKKTADAPPALVPERLQIMQVSASVSIGQPITFTLTYFDNMAQQQAVPQGIIWSSSNTNVATVANGIAMGVGEGQTEIKATLGTTTAVALLTVVSNNSQLALISLMPASMQEIGLNETATLVAKGSNAAGGEVSGLTFSWLNSNDSIVTLGSNGMVTGKAYGTSNVTALAGGIRSAPVMVQVIRRGSFAGSRSAGTAKLKIENGVLKIETSSNFNSPSGPPDLRIYLGNNNGNVNGALEIATLNNRNGAQSWNIPAGVSITQYRYVLIWCKQLGGLYGLADLGN